MKKAYGPASAYNTKPSTDCKKEEAQPRATWCTSPRAGRRMWAMASSPRACGSAKTWARGLAYAPRTFRAMKTQVLALMAKAGARRSPHTSPGRSGGPRCKVGKHQRGCCCHRWLSEHTPSPRLTPRPGCLPLTGASFLAVGLGLGTGGPKLRPPPAREELAPDQRPGGRAQRRVRGLGLGGCPPTGPGVRW